MTLLFLEECKMQLFAIPPSNCEQNVKAIWSSDSSMRMMCTYMQSVGTSLPLDLATHPH